MLTTVISTIFNSIFFIASINTYFALKQVIMATWKQDIIIALEQLKGKGSLDDIYDRVKSIRNEKLPKSWHAIIRGTIETHSSDSEAYTKREDLFYSVDGIGSGNWGLRSHKKI